MFASCAERPTKSARRDANKCSRWFFIIWFSGLVVQPEICDLRAKVRVVLRDEDRGERDAGEGLEDLGLLRVRLDDAEVTRRLRRDRARGLGRGRNGREGGRRRFGGKGDDETRAAGRRRLDARIAAVRARELAHDRQTDAAAVRARVHCGVSLLEASEDALAEFLVDAHAGVAHGDLDAAVLLGELDADASAARRELQRVREEVGDDAIDRAFVCAHGQGFGPVVRHGESARRRDVAPHGNRRFRARREIEGRDAQLEPVFLAGGEDEESVDQPQELAGARFDAIELLDGFLVEVRAASPHVRDREADQRERCADLVVDVREELVARGLRFLQLTDGLVQLVGSLFDLSLEVEAQCWFFL